MILKKTNSLDADFKFLIHLLDQNLIEINGDIQADYDEHNLIDFIETVIVVYDDEIPVGCGCFKNFGNDGIEIKRMYTKPEARGKGVAKAVLTSLEDWALSLGYSFSVLETGRKHHEAIHLYHKLGYYDTEKYEPYVDMDESVCMRKNLG
jgi:GNAT superfamily N-acetyltransferase